MNFEPIIEEILRVEGGYVDHPDDRGGPTNFGITLAVARKNGWQGDMRALPESLAREIYRRRYIAEPKFDLVALIDEPIGMELIDTGVNMGPAHPAMFLQRWLNAFNDTGSRYADLFVDGRIGQVTLDALKAFLRWRGREGSLVLLRSLNCLQGTRYLEISERDRTQRSFVYGQMRGRVL